MRVTGDTVHVFRKNEFGDQLEHTIHTYAGKAYSISCAAKLFGYAISRLRLHEGGISAISLEDISTALELIETESYELGSKIACIGESMERGIFKELNKYDGSKFLISHRRNTHSEDLQSDE